MLPSNNLFALGPWCGSGNTEPSPNGLGLSHESDIDVESVSSQLVLQLESTLYPALNALHNVNLAREVWRFSLGTYLRVLTPLLVTRYNLVQRAISEVNCTAFTDVPVEIERIVPRDRTELQALVNSHAWNHYVFSEICRGLGLAPQGFPEIEPDNDFYWQQPKHHAPHRKEFAKTVVQRACNAVAKRRNIVVTQTLLPSRIEFGVALKHVSLPVFWRGDESYSDKVQMNLRTKLYEALPSSDSFAATLLAIIIQTLPRLFVEDFARIRTTTKTRLPTKPRVVFTSNLHMASDQFLLWLSEARASGTKVVIGQHGGVHCLARDTPVEARIEVQLADRYLAWGEYASQVRNGARSPILVNVGFDVKRKREQSPKKKVLIVLDSPYRYPSPPRGLNGNRFQYARMLNALASSKPLHENCQVVMRMYAGAERFDDSLRELLTSKSTIEFESGALPIKAVLKSADLVITTSIGTTMFHTLSIGIPTLVLLEPSLSPLSNWAAAKFSSLEASAVYFSDPRDLLNHLENHSFDLSDWWNSARTTTAVREFLSEFSLRSEGFLTFYSNQISEVAAVD
jgi:putative transferase (TIGR04331 family)